jgi:hypothetical protein
LTEHALGNTAAEDDYSKASQGDEKKAMRGTRHVQIACSSLISILPTPTHISETAHLTLGKTTNSNERQAVLSSTLQEVGGVNEEEGDTSMLLGPHSTPPHASIERGERRRRGVQRHRRKREVGFCE